MSFEKTLKPFCKGTIEVMNDQGITVRKNITAQYLDSQILLVSGLDQDVNPVTTLVRLPRLSTAQSYWKRQLICFSKWR